MGETRDIVCEGGCETILGNVQGMPGWTEEKWKDALSGYRCTPCATAELDEQEPEE